MKSRKQFCTKFWLNFDAKLEEMVGQYTAMTKHESRAAAIRCLIEKGLKVRAVHKQHTAHTCLLSVLYDCSRNETELEIAEFQRDVWDITLAHNSLNLEEGYVLKLFVIDCSPKRLQQEFAKLKPGAGVLDAWITECLHSVTSANGISESLASIIGQPHWHAAQTRMLMAVPVVMRDGGEWYWKVVTSELTKGFATPVSFSFPLKRRFFLHVLVLVKPAVKADAASLPQQAERAARELQVA
jgi:metal-responsive CopG/Arc/MetJ family transcriptional regulator